MNPFSVRGLVSLAVVAGLVSTPAFAQKKPKENVVVWLGVHASVRANAQYSIRFQSSMPGEADPYFAWHTNQAGNSTSVESGNVLVQVYPGRTYTFSMGCAAWTGADVQFNVPAGYTLYMGPAFVAHVPRTTFATDDFGGGTGVSSMDIELRPNDGSANLPAGYAVAPTVGEVTWAVSAGTLATGRSAGTIRWREGGVGADLLDALSLSYANPDGSQIATWYYPDGALKYVGTPQIQLYVRKHSGSGYTIEVYGAGVPFDYAGDPDNDWSFDGDDDIEYDVSNPDGSWLNRVRVTKYDRASGHSDIWTLAVSGGVTTVTETSSLRTLRLSSSSGPGLNQRTEIATVEESGGAVKMKTRRIYQGYVWGEELLSETADPDGLALTTSYTYDDSWLNPATTGTVTKLTSVTRPDGSWEKYEYYEDFARWGQLKSVSRPFQDAPSTASAATASNCVVTTYNYASERGIFSELNAGTETKINGTTTAKTIVTPSLATLVSYDYQIFPFGNALLRTDTVQEYSAAGASQTTTRKVFHTTDAPEYGGRLYSQVNPDGSKVSASYLKGSIYSYVNIPYAWSGTYFHVSSDSQWCETYLYGTSTQTTGDSVLVSTDGVPSGKAVDPLWMIPYKSTRKQVVRDPNGNPCFELTCVFNGSGFDVIGWEERSIGGDGLLYGKKTSLAETWGASRIAGRVNYETAVDGTQTQYFFDDLMRVTRADRKGVAASGSYPAQPAIYTNYTYDAAGHVLTTSTYSPSGGPTLSTSSAYNLAGLLTSQTDASGLTTSYAYSNGGRTVTVTLPGGGTQITDHYLDGSLKSVGGTAVVGEYHATTVETSGALTAASYVLRSADVANPTAAPRWSKSTADWLGRKLTDQSPSPTGSGTFTRNYYYSAGHLAKTTEPGMAATLYQYNGLGELQFTGLDLNANDTLDLASDDRVTETRTKYTHDGGIHSGLYGQIWSLDTDTFIYAGSGSGTATQQSHARTKLCPYWDTSPGKGDISDSDYGGGKVYYQTSGTDIFGNVTSTYTAIDRPGRLTTVTTDLSDSSVDSVAVAYNGRAVKQQSAQNLTTYFHSDNLGRQTEQVDPRTGTVTTAYSTSGTGAIGRVSSVTDAASNVTSYTYESATGRLASTTNALGKVSYQSYNTRGQATRSWGETTYPVEYGFDDYGQQTTLSTFRGGTGWTGSTWPGSPGTADTTTWAYDNATGLLTSKTDAASHAVSYTYNARGQLATRTWGRGTVSTYSYDSGTAEQTGISYSDSTPGITYTYNRLGQSATVADVTGTRTFAYSATTTALNTETFPSYFDSRVLTRHYDTTTTGALGRNTGYTLSGASGSGTDNEVSYGYDAYGRFNGIATPSSGPAFTYSFASNSNLVASISETSGWTETNTYEAHRNLLTQIKGQFGTPVKAQFDLTHDALGRRLTAVDSGEIFARYNSSALATHYGYNDRSEVISAQSYYGTSTTDTSSPVIDRGYTYAFDNIGNRTSSAVIGNGGGDTHTTTYTNNALNQVTARAGPGSVDVTGLGPSAATITVNSASTTRQGDFYYKNVTVGSTPAWLSASVTSSLGGSGTRYSFVPPSSETHTYDADGNLTADGRWSYTWDAENRLASMETVSGASAVGVPRQLIQFKYDYLGRRVRKIVSAWTGSAYVASLDRKFIYNGWNLLAEYAVPSSGISPLASAYIWGLDLSGNLVDGGGVGGLLAIKDVANSAWHLPYYDANGNLHALADRASGTITAAYEYSPFGETLRATGTYAAANVFRFSTKYADAETQLLYYGYRYYNPSLGRWLGRDPLGEKGGVHLYAFCRNSAVNTYDRLGMIPLKMDDIWDEDMPDTDFVNEHQPTWVKVGGSSWYDTKTGIQRNYKGHSEAYYASLVEGSSMGPVGGTINPSLLQQINSTFAWSASFSAGVSVAQAIEAANSASANGRLRNDTLHTGDVMSYDDKTKTWKPVPGTGTNFGKTPTQNNAASTTSGENTRVYIWNAQGTSVGHVMVTNANGTQSWLSQFPHPEGGNITPYAGNDNYRLSPQATFREENRAPDGIYLVTLSNSDAFRTTVRDQVLGRSDWDWYPSNSSDQTHCSYSTYCALTAGGLPLPENSGQILPGTIDDYLHDLAMHPESTSGTGSSVIQVWPNN